jgi:hypothetical protein
MRRLLPFSLILVAGCSSSMPHPQANISHPARDIVGNPYVLVIGDALVTAWGANTANQPMWTFAGSPAGSQEVSGSVLARLPALLASRHFDVIVVLVGTIDMVDLTWQVPCGIMEIAPEQTCQNMSDMASLAHNAGAKVLFCTVPYTLDIGQAGTQLFDENPYLTINEDEFNRGVLQDPFLDTGGMQEDGIVNISSAAEGITWTTDGLVPNDTGAQLFTSVTQGAIAGLRGNWGAR